MDKSNENPNPFLPLDKSSKYQESKIFGGNSLQFQGGASNPVTSLVTKPSHTQNVFGNPSVFGSFPSSSNSFGQISKDSGKPPNLFGKSFQDVATSSSVQTGNIFGSTTSKTSSNTIMDPLSQNTALSSNSNSFASKPVNESFNTKVFSSNSQQSNPESTQLPQSSAIFSLQSRENKDSKDNIFGGNVDQSQPRFKSFEEVKESKLKGGEFSSSNEKTKNQSPSFPVFGKPEKVFANVKTTKEPPPKSFAFESLIKGSSGDKQSSIFQKTSAADVIDNSSKQFVEQKDIQNKSVQSSVLIACNIPSNYVDPRVLKPHFSKFGTVQKVTVNPKTSQAVIHFADSKSAQEAKVKGKRLHPLLEEMKLFFGSQPQLTKPVEKGLLKAIKESPKTSPRSSPYNKKLDTLAKTSKNIKAIERNRSPNLVSKPETKNKAPSGNLVSLKDFSVIVKTQAKNNYDKFLILDARDKNIRAKQEKIVDVKKARYLLASCPDMCPEKERYSRDIQYDISEYESTNNEMNHKLTVKKFSRSSADKDEPLPHELRPGPVLKMTMNFLLCNIVQKGDDPNVQVDLWYNYLCNRTRGLRSDIMQQHLVDDNAVYVLERCIRFHIHCSHALCEESPEYFDAKINFEHLSKSLQSLKELYHDLEDKGHSFKNESEFRCYEILLSINDGNVIFKYLKFKEAIRNSTEVQFGIKVLHSIHTGNYANFFKLLKRATYLQSCIMHKYFAIIRQKALNIIIKAYSTQSSPPVDSIKSMLGFSNEEELLKYIDHYGIHINELTSVQNKSKSLITPTTTPPVSKSAEITKKKVQSIGEVINNGPLPDNPLTYYKPHNSFNSDGYLRKKAIDASDQSRATEVANKPVDERVIDAVSVVIDKPEKESENKDTYMEMSILKSKKKYELILLSRYFKNWKKFTTDQRKIKDLQEKHKIYIAKKIFILWKNKAHKSVISRGIAKKLLVRRCFRKWREYISWQKEVKETIAIVKKNEMNILRRKYFTLWQKKVYVLKAEREEKYARNYILKFRYFHRWLSITRESIANKKSDKLYHNILLRTYFLQWKSWLVGRKSRNKVNIDLFPAVGSLLSVETQNLMFDWGYDRDDDSYISSEEIARLDEDIFIKNLKHDSVDKLSSIMSWMPLPLIQKFQSEILVKPPDLSGNLFHTCFKILLLIDYTHIDQYFLRWIRTKFNILEYEDLSKPLHCESHFTSSQNKMKYSILFSEKRLPQEFNEMDSCSLVILVGNENKLELLKKFSKTLGQLPFLILCKSSFKNDLSHSIWLMSKETIENPYTSEKLCNFIVSQWSVMSDRFKYNIGCCLKIVTGFIFHKVVSCINHELSHRQLYGNPNLQPTTIVSFYNAGILHIISSFEKTKSQICNGLLFEKFAQNFLYSSMGNDQKFEEVLSSLRNACLPQFNVEFDKSESEIESYLFKYIKEVSSSSSWKGNLYSEVKLIIKETKKKFFEDQFYCSDAISVNNFWYYIPWVEIFNAIILFKTSTLPDVDIVYRQTDLDEFDTSKYWVSEVKMSELVAPDLEEREPSVKRKATITLPRKDPKKIKADSLLLQNIEEEKRIVLEFERKLRSLMSADAEEILHNFIDGRVA